MERAESRMKPAPTSAKILTKIWFVKYFLLKTKLMTTWKKFQSGMKFYLNF